MSDKRNLGRGLGDMMNEVSTVRAMPVQPAVNITEALAAARAQQPQQSTATPEVPENTGAAEQRELTAAAQTIVEQETHAAATIVEERPPDAEDAKQEEPRVVEKLVKMPFVPLWAKLAVAVLMGIIIVLIVTLTQFQANIAKLESELGSATTELAVAHAELTADPLVWTERIKIPGVKLERFGKNARFIFENPFFVTEAKWSPATDEMFRALLSEIAPNAGKCFVTVVGHTARQPVPRGLPYRDNYELGQRRALAVVDAMVRGVKWPVSRVSARSDGDKYPPYRGDDPLTHARNRTITIEVRPD
jgi:flagellar motor protein MotB